MTKPILAGHDPKGEDPAPVRFGVRMSELTGAPLLIGLVALRVPMVIVPVHTLPFAVSEDDDDLDAACASVMDDIAPEVSAHRVKVECEPLQDTSAARALHLAAEKEDAALLVVGGSSRTADRLLSGAPCPVTVVPRGWMQDGPPSRIAVAYVGGDEGDAALRGAEALARRAGATLRVITVTDDGEARDRVRARVDELLGDSSVEIQVLAGDAAEELIAASANFDLIVCGSRGYGPVRAVLLGSVTHRVVRESRCPVIVVPRGVKTTLEALVAETAGVTASP
jgi:nucleotide-binding universal stress UspA family protein